MKKTIKAWIYTATAMSTALYSETFAKIEVGTAEDKIKWSGDSAEKVIQNWISSALGFLYLAAVIYGLWWGFHILTAGWDDDKVGQGKKIIINSLIGIVVIFLASSIVQWLINIVSGTGSTWG
jgi:hypothetical protein